MKKNILIATACTLLAACTTQSESNKIEFPEVSEVTVTDSFWSPKLEQWRTTTANDVFDKFEAKHIENDVERLENDAFRNFDLIAQGERGISKHAGPPWYDGLVYESIRGVADLLAKYPDKAMEARIDAYVERIAAAQDTDPNGYINTYTDLMEPDHRWGDNGGFLRLQHDVYNSGMLFEAAVHYYKATGKTNLLKVATKLANHMSELMGPAPKRNIIPAHAGPEEALVKLYWLYRDNPTLEKEVGLTVNEKGYYELAKFWIEGRGNHCGYPHWKEMGNYAAEQWIEDNKYLAEEFGNHSRPSWGEYAQDSVSVFEQKTIEGHAVRATLLATGMASVAINEDLPQYVTTLDSQWDNMVGKRLFITGGVGAVHFDEKFGDDYFLPTDAYLETCAAVGSAFFSQRMNQIKGGGIYMDEYERSLYNNVLTGISLSGTEYTYQNPLNTDKHSRWEWHGCPCCPPMFLKIVSSMPGNIYAHSSDAIYVNLFISSEAKLKVGKNEVAVKQETRYPWQGDIKLTVNPAKEGEFAVKVRIPGWAVGKENPFDLYTSDLKSAIAIKVNGQSVDANIVNGYADIKRIWKAGDMVEVQLPMAPRIVTASSNVETLAGLVSLASGPIVYSFESVDNADLESIVIDRNTVLEMKYEADLLGGVNVIRGKNSDGTGFTAVPFYAVGNRHKGDNAYRVWVK